MAVSVGRADQPEIVSADYKTQERALLDETPSQLDSLDEPASLADYSRAFY